MSFRNPIAWIGLAALLVPLVIHLLVRAPARPIVLASLRFVPASPMRALRRRLLNEAGLLALRIAILALAVAALANPLVSSACRRRGWNARLARAVVVDTRGGPEADPHARNLAPVSASHRIDTDDLRQGLGEAIRWLHTAPPARREVVVIGRLPLGSVDAADLRDIPAHIGLRFVRSVEPGRAREVAGGRVSRRVEDGIFTASRLLVTLDGERTMTRTMTESSGPTLTIEETALGVAVPALAFEGIALPPSKLALRAAVTAALVVGVPLPGPGAERPLVLVLDEAGGVGPRPVGSVTVPWIGDAIAHLAADGDVVTEARAVRATTQGPLSEGWTTLVRDDDGRVVVAAAVGTASPTSGRAPSIPALLLLARAKATSPLLPALIRSALQARDLEVPVALRDGEVLPIPDVQLERWSRPAREVSVESLPNDSISDRRWAWGLVLALLGLEGWARRRRARAGPNESAHGERASKEEASGVRAA